MVTEILPVVNHDGGDDGGNSNYWQWFVLQWWCFWLHAKYFHLLYEQWLATYQL